MIDKLSIKVLRELYHNSLGESDFNKIIERTDMTQPNEIETFLLSEKLIKVKISGEPDGEGGYIPETVTRTYSITRYGKAVVESANKDRFGNVLDILSKLKPW